MTYPAYQITYDEKVFALDLHSIPRNMQDRIRRAIESRLTTAPASYGARLKKSLVGLWKLRVGDYRIVYELHGMSVRIMAIVHRRDAYQKAEMRWAHREG